MIVRSQVSPEVRSLLEHERVIPPVSASQRARALARARAAMASQGVAMATFVSSSAAPRRRWVAAAAAALVISAALGAAAYEIHARVASAPMTHRAVVIAAPQAVVSAPVVPAPATAAGDLLPPAPTPTMAAAGPSPAAAARVELHLLRQARGAVARGDFAAALSPIAEHTRRFKNGRFVEEREALRVKALGGLGRIDEARHAAAAFRARFPRSVLLPAVSQMPASGP